MLAFDFDGTLIDRDSFPLFAIQVLGKRKMLAGLLLNLPVLIRWKTGLTDPSSAKQRLFSTWFKGLSREEAERQAELFAATVEERLRPEARERLRRAIRTKEQVVIVSASPGLWIRPWARRYGIEVIATEAEWRDGKLTGRFATPNCKGAEKVRRFKERFRSGETLTEAWGDSRDDLPLLFHAERPVWVGKGRAPDGRLLRPAETEGDKA